MSGPMTLEAFDEKTFIHCLELIHGLTGITVAPNRKSMVEGRLRKRALGLGLRSYAEYLRRVRESSEERLAFIDLMTTNETYFYRTPRIWEFIAGQFLPRWHERHPGRVFQAWSAAASSGEEAHTLGILLQAFKERNPGFGYRILGTDISREMVRQCETGLYRGRSIEAFRRARPDLFSAFVRKAGTEGDHRVVPEIRERMSFKTHNLFDALASPASFDLVLARNVLIYFVPEDQEKVIAQIERKLSPDGILVIGESESLSRIRTGLKARAPLIYSWQEAAA